MAQGLKKIHQRTQAEDRQRQAAAAARDKEGPRIERVRLPNDLSTAIIRPIVEEPAIVSVYLHKVPNSKNFQKVWCLDQEDDGARCPACDIGDRRSERLTIPVIWYDHPKPLLNEKGWQAREEIPSSSPKRYRYLNEMNADGSVKTEPILAVWDPPVDIASRMVVLSERADSKITPHTWVVTRRGMGTKTTYDLDLLNRDEPVTEADKQLAASLNFDPRTLYDRMGENDMRVLFVGEASTASAAPADNIYTRQSTQNAAINVGAFQKP